jgi:hypothetical protein
MPNTHERDEPLHRESSPRNPRALRLRHPSKYTNHTRRAWLNRKAPGNFEGTKYTQYLDKGEQGQMTITNIERCFNI